MKNGFTLVELLATIVIMSILTLIGTVGLNFAKEAIYQNIWNSNVEFIEASAESLGTDKKEYIKSLTSSCTIDSVKKSPCLEVDVQTLIDRGYLVTQDFINYNDDDNYKVVINKTVTKSDNEDENFTNGYYVNKYKVAIYIENNIVYAKYLGTK